MANMRSDPIISACDERFGNRLGYTVFNLLLEMVAEKSPHNSNEEGFGTITITTKTLKRELNLSTANYQKVAKVLRFLAMKRLLTYRKRNNWITITFPKMAQIKDNYTK